MDSSLIFDGTESMLIVAQSGSYWVEYTSPDGCKSISDSVVVELFLNPETPIFSFTGNLLELNDPGILPANYTLQWYENGVAIPDAVDISYCITSEGTNNYTLEVLDWDSGCSSSYSLGVTFDSNFDCTVATNDLEDISNSISIFPNPNGGVFEILLQMNSPSGLELRIHDLSGKVWYQENLTNASSDYQKTLDITTIPNGLYFVQIITENGVGIQKVMKQ